MIKRDVLITASFDRIRANELGLGPSASVPSWPLCIDDSTISIMMVMKVGDCDISGQAMQIFPLVGLPGLLPCSALSLESGDLHYQGQCRSGMLPSALVA